jgi:hypothetical protein
VTTIAEVRRLATEVAASLGSSGIRVALDDVPLLLVGRDRIKSVSTTGHPLAGFTDYTLTPTAEGASIQSFNVVLLYGVPETEMRYALAHEIMHVWLFRNNVPSEEEPLIEGSCHYASYLVLKPLGTREADFVVHRMTIEPDSTYGGGFRRVKSYVDEHGVDAWLAMLRSLSHDSAASRQ